ncbi:hypothetical protein B566_EDAN016612 [Ephemera danica]|nr:hypothetical protein B566_EDAN016612 [Ephemera danica]
MPQNLVMMGPFPDCDIKLCDFEISRVILEGAEVPRCDGVRAIDGVLAVRSARMTSKECLRHPWLAKKTRTLTAPSLLSGSIATGINSRRSESPVHQAGGSGTAAAQKNLRKYLSKSREALFERVSGSNLRKTLSKSRERLCESHLSLVSKSRERLLMLEPSSRSIEKLYGLRSLSKSQDALSAQEMIAINPVLAAQHLLRCQSEATSLGRDPDTPDKENEKKNIVNLADSVKPAKIPRDRTISDNVSSKTKDENNKENHEKSEVSKPNTDASSVSLAQLGVGADENKLKRVFTDDSQKNDETGSDSSDKTIRERSPGPNNSEEDEPRYSVAQLVTAFNKNDQVAATSALTYDRTIPNKLKFVSSFPTGANALRLFIPDIMISERKQQSPPSGNVSDSQKEYTPSPDSSLSPAPSMEEQQQHSTVDEANNNNTQCHNNSDCQYLKVPETQNAAVVLARSGSLSSEASGYDTLSGASSLVSLEENNSPPISLTQTKKPPQRPRSSSLHGDMLRPPWGTVCTGSYSRAMERFHNKNNLVHQPNNQQRQRRKSSPIIKTPMK